jgi:hypothetical protein
MFISWKSKACGWSLTPFFERIASFPPPPKKTSSAAKPILACLYKTLTLMFYNLLNLPNLMGARRSCGKLLFYAMALRQGA